MDNPEAPSDSVHEVPADNLAGASTDQIQAKTEIQDKKEKRRVYARVRRASKKSLNEERKNKETTLRDETNKVKSEIPNIQARIVSFKRNAEEEEEKIRQLQSKVEELRRRGDQQDIILDGYATKQNPGNKEKVENLKAKIAELRKTVTVTKEMEEEIEFRNKKSELEYEKMILKQQHEALIDKKCREKTLIKKQQAIEVATHANTVGR